VFRKQLVSHTSIRPGWAYRAFLKPVRRPTGFPAVVDPYKQGPLCVGEAGYRPSGISTSTVAIVLSAAMAPPGRPLELDEQALSVKQRVSGRESSHWPLAEALALKAVPAGVI